MKNDIIKFLENKKILILGYGKEGASAYDFIIKNVKYKELAIADIKDIDIPSGIKTYIGSNYLTATKDYEIVIKSPGVIIKNYIADEEKKKITSLTDLFLRFSRNTIIGVIGTKGKSTTSSLIYHILIKNGYQALLLGNIGIPCFSALDNINDSTIIVYELSCHQLEFVKASPNIAVLLNIYEEHLDHYISMNAYVQTKKNIYEYQNSSDYLIYGDIHNFITNEEIENILSKKIDINTSKIDFSNIETKLVGEHNKKNVIAAINVAMLVGISEEAAIMAIKDFEPLEHRMEYVGEYKGIKFYNDSIATAVASVINAVESLKEVDTIIIGGMDRGLDYHELVEFLVDSDVTNILLLPNTNSRIKKLFDETKNTKNVIEVENMTKAIEEAYKCTMQGKICLLSPAAASYGFYKNFEERGKDFKELVKKYGL